MDEIYDIMKFELNIDELVKGDRCIFTTIEI